uniref:Plasmodesmata callose-binding protein 5 n=1 Tax=Noccaea caerulescens TaxID=107243 RepID=A0A1J3IRI1_NOCCA
MSLSQCFHLHLSLLAATAAVLMAVAAAQFGGQVLQVELWCVAKNNAEDSSLQTAIEWACGQGGADCGPIQQGGPCNDPTDIQKMASYVFNNYYLKNGLADDACNFDNNAALTSINPSQGTCKYPSSKRVSNGRVADDTSMDAGQADVSRGRQISSSWILAFIGFISVFTMAPIIHG